MGTLAVVGEGLVELSRLGGTLSTAPGGDASNIAVMAAACATPVRLAARVGADPFGRELLEYWRAAGVDTTFTSTDPQAPTGLYLNSADDGGHRFTYWRTGSAGSRLDADLLLPSFYDRLDVLAITGVSLTVCRAATAQATMRAVAAGARIACVLNYRAGLDADPSVIAAVAGTCDIVIGSREDTRVVFDTTDVDELAEWLPHAREIVITAGHEPVTARHRAEKITCPVPTVTSVDAACAGDAFAGAYLARRVAGAPMTDAVVWGVAASAHSVTHRGCAQSYPTREQTAALVDQLAPSAA